MRRKLAAGNWKMNGLSAELDQIDALTASHATPSVDLLLCPPATLVAAAAARVGSHPMMIGGQDCHMEDSGAYTGDVSAPMLADAGAGAVILGHSERRDAHEESDEMVRAKAEAAHRAGLIAVVCLGESLDQREAGQTLDIIGAQLAASVPDAATSDTLVIAYEPIWAIGTGKVPTLEQIAEVHDFIRARLEDRFGTEQASAIRLLYGGSVKPDNASDIFAVSNVDGALVGGASLKAADFSPIIKALEAAN
ncbi:triose-phosphate isomerase [Thalassovita mangrovi]|uniref:Triosephosphate isomerase n=1 Tax=Thalassovita mangrovi TaxID=2692236 RepID=A0A6L8LIB2_9RHOB|nr:triose-phosphate isomerase [Thalassovita mangrovi]MYM55748.1 triose-phosphate isomerase [Thalassovita mangrovi]